MVVRGLYSSIRGSKISITTKISNARSALEVRAMKTIRLSHAMPVMQQPTNPATATS